MEDVYRSVDQDGKGYVSVLDLQIILSLNQGKNYNMRDLEFLLRLYDREGRRKIVQQDFLKELGVRIDNKGLY